MKTIVIYNSQTGFTKQYAGWISEELSCECVSLKQAGKINFADYEAIVFGSWCMAGSLKKTDWFKKQLLPLAQSGKKLLVFAVGASDADSPEIKTAMDKISISGAQIKAIGDNKSSSVTRQSLIFVPVNDL